MVRTLLEARLGAHSTIVEAFPYQSDGSHRSEAADVVNQVWDDGRARSFVSYLPEVKDQFACISALRDSPPTLGTHLRSELQAKDSMRRQMALLDINTLAYCTASCNISLRSVQNQQIRIENETGSGAFVDLDVLVPDLVKSYRQGPADGHRLLALSALLQIGNEKKPGAANRRRSLPVCQRIESDSGGSCLFLSGEVSRAYGADHADQSAFDR